MGRAELEGAGGERSTVALNRPKAGPLSCDKHAPLVGLQASTALGPQSRLGGGAPRRRRRPQQPTGLRRTGGGESFLRVHSVAVPKALRARRVNRHGGPAGSLLIFSAWKFVLTAAMMAAPIPIGVLVRGGLLCLLPAPSRFCPAVTQPVRLRVARVVRALATQA
jgi:hypothetical protein